MNKFIVAEVTKNWIEGKSSSPLLSNQFEEVIEVNLKRGYQLHSFQIHQLLIDNKSMAETIIAVFEKASSSS